MKKVLPLSQHASTITMAAAKGLAFEGAHYRAALLVSPLCPVRWFERHGNKKQLAYA